MMRFQSCINTSVLDLASPPLFCQVFSFFDCQVLPGTLFQNNFEELYTCLNIVRPGFVKTFAETAGLKFNMQQVLFTAS